VAASGLLKKEERGMIKLLNPQGHLGSLPELEAAANLYLPVVNANMHT